MRRVEVGEFLRAVENNELGELDRLPEGLSLTRDFVYSKPAERELRLDIYDVYDTERNPDGPRPAIVFIHGGGWRGGTKNQFARQAAYLASKYGLLAVCCEYRLSGEAPFPACLHDCKCAVRWVRSQTEERGVDPERVAAAGGSAGGHLAAMLATTAGVAEYEGDGGYGGLPSHVNLCIPHNPAVDLVPLGRRSEQAAQTAVRELLGGSLEETEEMPDAYRAASPYHRASAATPPTLLMHGDADATIVCEQSIAMYEKLLRLGVDAELEVYPGKGHGWFNAPPDFAAVLGRMDGFLAKHFGLTPLRAE